jgi:hypothetical protein
VVIQVEYVTGDASSVIKEPVDFVYLNAHRDFCSVSAWALITVALAVTERSRVAGAMHGLLNRSPV